MATCRLALGLAVVVLVGSVGGIPAIATGEAQPLSMGEKITDATTGDARINSATSDGPAKAGDLTDDAEGIAVTQRLHLTPDEPGDIEVVLAASLPERVESFGMQIPDRVRVTGTNGRTTTVPVRGITARETDTASGSTSRGKRTVGTPHATDGDATRTSGPGFTALLALLVIVFSLWLR
ncbi:hypothetical protein [Halorhabdus rudnickae]|uniref:hypothetical protein n=1 Tax=Halorhabdus rudnickae TaxID=1775544 RepID=UPI0010843FD7|nr:hypothetical protein [Halorhabdus rudnickae]